RLWVRVEDRRRGRALGPAPEAPPGLLGGHHADDADAVAVVAGARDVTVAVGGAAVARRVRPAAAAERLARAGGRPRRVQLGAGLVVAGVLPVGGPLADVTVHVVQAPGVGLVRADLGGALQVRPLGRVPVGRRAVAVGVGAAQGVAEVEHGG